MPSFDIVSEVSLMEVKNAIQQANRELTTRFDFKGVKADIELDDNAIKLSAQDKSRLDALVEIVIGKLAKRDISLKNIDRGDPEISPTGHARMVVELKQGIDGPLAKEISSFVRALGLKLTAAIQGDSIRVTGKKRDDLQQAMQSVKAKDFPLDLHFINFRD